MLIDIVVRDTRIFLTSSGELLYNLFFNPAPKNFHFFCLLLL